MEMNELIQVIAKAYKNPGTGEADQNGNTRLSVLQKRFHLSSLKVQKILVTAGVYQPVKRNSPYEEITKLHKEGKSMEEIMQATHLSDAAVSAYLPYEKSVYHADEYGADISDNAKRKRRQRNVEEMKKLDIRNQLRNSVTDDSFWKAIQEHEGELFLTHKGERYSFEVIPVLSENNRNAFCEKIQIYPERGNLTVFSKDEVLEILHRALEQMASEKEEMHSFEQTEAFMYIGPLLVVFDILPGDKTKFIVKRSLRKSAVCSCCGCRADYTVNTYADLVKISAQIEEEERSKWDPEHRKEVERMETSSGRISWQELAEKDNPVIRAFNKEGERQFCMLCAETIRMALEGGDLPRSSQQADLSTLSEESAKAVFDRVFTEMPDNIRYIDGNGCEYDSAIQCYFCKEKDTEGVEHCFACMMTLLPGFMIFEAKEVHKLTKAGKFARDYTGTDYEFRSGYRETYSENGIGKKRKIYIGFLELAGKIRDGLRNPSLKWHKGTPHFSNAMTIGSRQCSLDSMGQMKVVYVNEHTVQGREWNGDQYGFMIDGIIFTGDEVSLLASTYEGWNLQYRFSDSLDNSLREGEYLMPVQIGEKQLVTEMTELLNLFTADGKFISPHDAENFGILFEKDILKKLKLYYDSNPSGYGKLAGMRMIRQLEWVEGTDLQAEQIRQIIQR